MKTLWQSRAQADIAADKLRRFAQPQRLMILSLLLEGEKSVTEIDMASGIGQPALSQQLAELRKAELVTTRRQAKQVYYSLADDTVLPWEEYEKQIIANALRQGTSFNGAAKLLRISHKTVAAKARKYGLV